MIRMTRTIVLLLAALSVLSSCRREEPKRAASAPARPAASTEISPYLEARRIIVAVEQHDGPTTDSLVSQATTGAPYVRRWALWAIGEAIDDTPEVNNALRQGIVDEDAAIRTQAVESARLIGAFDPEMIEPLRRIIREGSPQDVWNAEVALGDMGEIAAPAIPDIAARIGTDRVGVGAIRSLGKIGEGAYPALLHAFAQETDEGMRSEIIAAFLMDPKDTPEVRDLMQKQADEGKGTFAALGRLWIALVESPRARWGTATEEIIADSDFSIRVILLVLSKEIVTPGQHLDILAKFLEDTDPRVRYASAVMVMDRGAEALPLLPELLRIPESSRDDVDVWVKSFDKKALPYLRKALDDERSRLPAAILLAQIDADDLSAATVLVDAIREKRNASVAAAALAQIESLPMIAGEAMKEVAAADDNDIVLRSLARAVMVRANVNREQQLRQLLDLLTVKADDLGLEEEKALQFKLTILPFCLAQCGPAIIDDLKPYLADSGTRLFAVLALGQMLDQHPEAGKLLLDALLDPNAVVRRGAIAHLNRDYPEAEALRQRAREVVGDPNSDEFLRRDAMVILGILADPAEPPHKGTEDLLSAALHRSESPWVIGAAHYALAANAIDTPDHIKAIGALCEQAAEGKLDTKYFSGVLDQNELRTTLMEYLNRIGPEAESTESALRQK